MILFQVYIKYVLAVVECVYNCKRWDFEMYLQSTLRRKPSCLHLPPAEYRAAVLVYHWHRVSSSRLL